MYQKSAVQASTTYFDLSYTHMQGAPSAYLNISFLVCILGDQGVRHIMLFVQLGPIQNPKPKSWFVGPKLTLNLPSKPPPPTHPHKLFSQKGLSKLHGNSCVNLVRQKKIANKYLYVPPPRPQ